MNRILRYHLLCSGLCVFSLLSTYTQLHGQDVPVSRISIHEKNVPLETVFKAITKQTGLYFVGYANQLNIKERVTVDYHQRPVDEVLQSLLGSKGYTWSYRDNVIRIRQQPAATAEKKMVPERPASPAIPALSADTSLPAFTVTGKVSTPDGTALPGATVQVKGSNKGVITNASGIFVLKGIKAGDKLLFSYTSYETSEVPISSNATLDVHLREAMSNLDETVVIAYGTTTRRLNTGNVSRVTAKEIGQQPISNPLAALEGRVPGMVVTQNNGNPGAGFKVQIRGVTSVGAAVGSLSVSNDPLFIIDGVPFAPNNTSLGTIGVTALGEAGLSPFASINPNDIESIEVLKDADATAIYGSRGANGVVLITTKRGKPGKTKLNVGVNTGFSKIGRVMKLLNTQDYLQMRREAFQNDKVAPQGPEFDVFDTTRYTDFTKLLMGDPAPVIRVNSSLTGGTANTYFLIGAQYSSEKTVYNAVPGGKDFTNRSISLNANFNHTSPDNKLNIFFSASYSTNSGNLAAADPMRYVTNFAPNYPALFDEEGKLVWEYKGFQLLNPFADLYRRYETNPENLISNLTISYRLFPGLMLRSSFGYNTYQVKESLLYPAKANRPSPILNNSATFTNNQTKSWIIEPQIEYARTIDKLAIQALLGGTWQQNVNYYSTQQGTGFISDDLLRNLESASVKTASNSYLQYRYQAFFGRLNVNWDDRYILNISGRRDGSSRFGPDRQFANFGAVGAAWIFSQTRLFKMHVPFVSQGKLRASFGSAGNDKIGDYKYLDSWSSNITYQGVGGGLTPTALYNPEYNWEVNRKLEAALELGFINNRIIFSLSWYRNRSGNQLIDYKLSTQTGFHSIIQNSAAKVQNSGLEFEINTVNFNKRNFSWRTSFNISFNRNKLLAFPGLESSTYVTDYIIGAPLTVVKGYTSLGVNPITGVYQFLDRNNDGKMDISDRTAVADRAPKYFGGLNNDISYKGFKLSFFLSFKKQIGSNFISAYPNPAFGDRTPPAFILGSYWRRPGDVAILQRLTQNVSDAGNEERIVLLQQSDAIYSDASYIRLKNVALSYSLPSKWLNRMHLQEASIYISGQNLATITKFKGGDPEVGSFNQLPVFRTFTAGINLSL